PGPPTALVPCRDPSCRSNNSPRSGYEGSTALRDTSPIPVSVLAIDDSTRYEELSKPSSAARFRIDSSTGSSDESARSPPSIWAELRSRALETRSDRKPTLLMAAAAINNEIARSTSSPDRQSRLNARNPGARYLFQRLIGNQPRKRLMAASIRSTGQISRPSIGWRGAFALGTSARRNPSLAASLRRSCPLGAGRISPANPTSPNAISPSGKGLSRNEDMMARRTGRSAAG